ncbi:MAG: polysaccharide deacetylase family protein [Luteolibacter sp.]|nr:polysaccharide deacetylase family protein [Luteolibacter sp.]
MRPCILNFHGVGPVTRPLDQGELDCWLDSDFFEAVLDLVKKHPHVRMTVDDGNVSDFTHIVPALLRRGLSAVFFICSGRLDEPFFVSADQVREMLRAGMEIGSHGVAHVSWRDLSPRLLRDELEASRRDLGQVCGVPVVEAACPFGAYDRRVLKELRRAGYHLVFTSDGGRATQDAWIQPRTTVTRLMSLKDVEKLIVEEPRWLKRMSFRAKRFCKSIR